MNKILLAFAIAASCAYILGGMTMAAVILPNLANLKPGDTPGGNFPSSIHFVGNADGKSYMAENGTIYGFEDAFKYCERLGMSLATIKSLEQAKVLADGFDRFYFNGTFWTAGVDSHLIRQFSWNATNAALNGAYVQLEEHLDAPLTCVAYHSRDVAEGEVSHLDSAACHRLMRVLCET